LHLETIAAGAGADLKYFLAGDASRAPGFINDICNGWIYGIWVLARPESIPDLSLTTCVGYP